MSKHKPLGLGLIGCGGFGRFCLHAFETLKDVKIIAAAEPYVPTARACRQEFGFEVYHDSYELLARDDVQLVHIASPPATHRDLVLQCCVSHKHVLCEKPLAMSVKQADEMITAARKTGIICPVNFVLRHNRVTEKVKELLDSGVLGVPLSARLTNLASDSKLSADHWFWDDAASGGIFIEHGVHFFDLYEHWLGPGEVIFGVTARRPRTGQEDRVMCTVRHASGLLASHYHGFDQVAPLDRTDHRIVLELGEIRVQGWIPLTIVVDAIVNDEMQEQLIHLLPSAEMEVVAELAPEDRVIVGRGRERHILRRLRMSWTPNADKQAVYAQSVRELLADQVAYLRNPKHERRITELNGRDSVAMAEAAKRFAQREAQIEQVEARAGMEEGG